MFRDIQIVLISIAYWIIFPIQTFFAGLAIRILALWGEDRSHKAATDMLTMAMRIQQVQEDHPIPQKNNGQVSGHPFWIWFYHTNKNLINLNNHIIRWAISKYLSQKEKIDSKLAWLQ
jgi:hypothetical protein